MRLSKLRCIRRAISVILILSLFAVVVHVSSNQSITEGGCPHHLNMGPVIESQSVSPDPLPRHVFYLSLRDSMIGLTWISGSITMEVRRELNSSTGELRGYQHGFTIEPINAVQPPLSLEILGIGVDEIRRYPYVYLNSTCSVDFWKDREAQFIMYRSWPFWNTRYWAAFWQGGAWPEQMSGNVTFGQYIYLDGIRLYFENGIVMDSSPSHLLLWAEFRWNGSDWATSSGVWDSMNRDDFIDETAASLTVSFPAAWTNIIILTSIVSVTIVLVIMYRKRRALAEKLARVFERDKGHKVFLTGF